MACELCELAASLDAAGELVPVGRYWTANVRQSADRPAIVLQVREHRSGLEGLQAAEAAELGGVVQRTAAQLEDAPGVERVYAQSYNETPGHHVHVHVVPRFRGEHDLGPKAAADATPPPTFDIDAVVRRLASAPGSGGLLTQRVRGALGWLTRIPVGGKDRHPYSYLQRNMSRTGLNRWLSRFADAGEQFVLVAVVTEIVLVAAIAGLTRVDSVVAAVGAGVLAVMLVARAGDIAAFQLNILLTDETTALRGHGRSLLLALANLAELGLISAGSLTALGVPFGRGAVEGLRVATLQSELVAGGAATTAVLTVTMCTALLVAIGTIGVVIAKIGETFYHK